MRAYFSKRLPCAPADPAPVFLCVPYMRELESERAARAVLESSRSRLWLNSLFGESHVPGALSFTEFSEVRDFLSSCVAPKFCLLRFLFSAPKSLGSQLRSRRCGVAWGASSDAFLKSAQKVSKPWLWGAFLREQRKRTKCMLRRPFSNAPMIKQRPSIL